MPVVMEGVWFTACRAYLHRSAAYYASSINIVCLFGCPVRPEVSGFGGVTPSGMHF